MTYLQFHVLFLAPAIAVLAMYVRRHPPAGTPRGVRLAIPITAAIAFAYTIPWDNYLVYAGVWYYGPDRVVGTIGYVPVEEYLFFILQPVLTGFWVFTLASRPMHQRRGRAHRSSVLIVGICLLAITAFGVWCVRAGGEWTYLGLILAWACPVLAALWFWKGAFLLHHFGLVATGVIVPTLYLCLADRIAIAQQIWTITPSTSTGWHLVGLPVEEALFFFVTNLLCVFSVLIFLDPPGPSRYA